jgi:CTP-dependent riboflavin kinase
MVNVIVSGKIAPGVGRGKELIGKFYDRLRGVLMIDIYKGTLNVELEKPVNIKKYETKRMDHVLMDGKPFVEMRMAPVRLHFEDKAIPCWFIRQERAPHEENIVELISEYNLKEVLGLKDYDAVRVEFEEVPRDMFGRAKKAPQIIYPYRKNAPEVGTFERGRI